MRGYLQPLQTESPIPALKRSRWKRRVGVAVALLFGLCWLLVMPLPGPLARARHRWLLTGAEEPVPNKAATTITRWDNARGTITSTGESGAWTMQVTGCASGQLRAFYGVSLSDRGNPSLAARVVEPESGSDHITVSIPGNHREYTFRREDCSLWDVDMHFDGTVANSIYEVAGHARFTCLAEGAEVKGDVTLRSCNY